MNDYTIIHIPDWLGLTDDDLALPEPTISIPDFLPHLWTPSGIKLTALPKTYSMKLAQKKHRALVQIGKQQYEAQHAFYVKYNERVKTHNWRAMVIGLPHTLTLSDWRRALDYFHGCCAVCGHPMRDLFGVTTISFDHWITLSDSRPDNPGTVAWNILPMCHSLKDGQGACNNLKGSKPAAQWVRSRYSQRKAREILSRVETYFAWVKKRKNLG